MASRPWKAPGLCVSMRWAWKAWPLFHFRTAGLLEMHWIGLPRRCQLHGELVAPMAALPPSLVAVLWGLLQWSCRCLL